MSSIRTLGHAGLQVRAGTKRLVCDPWMSETGAFLASWHPFPDNHWLLSDADLLQPDFLYISHIHQDHFDPATLAFFDKKATVLIPRFPDRRLCDGLRALGFDNIRELNDGDVVTLWDGAEAMLLIEEIPLWHDSALAVRVDDNVVVNLNDCSVSERQVDLIQSTFGQVDLLFAQYSPANWFPICYDYSERRKRVEKQNQVDIALRKFTSTVRAFAPRAVVPFAGPPALLDPAHLPHCLGPDAFFPLPHRAVEAVPETEVLTCLPGDVVSLPDRVHTPEPRMAELDIDGDRDALIQEYAARRQPVIDTFLAALPDARSELFEQFAAHMDALVRAHPRLARRVNMQVVFEVKGPQGGFWVVDFRKSGDDVIVSRHTEDGAYPYRFVFEDRLLQHTLDGHITFDNLLLSLRFRASRSPNVFNETLMALLKREVPAALEPVDAWVDRERPKAYFTVEDGGRRYRVERNCPHAMGNLEHGVVEDGAIVCPRHGWRFSLEDGRCLTTRCRNLDVEEIES